MKFTQLLLLLIFSLTFSGLSAQKYSNEFLSIGISARAQALGNSVVASTNDLTAGYWNPAGLGRMTRDQGLQLGAMHSSWFAGVANFNYLGFSMPLASDNRRLAVTLIRFGIDNIPNTLSLFEADGTINYDNIVEFSAADYGILTSYGQKMKTKKGDLYLGGTVKIVRRIIGPFADSWGFGADLGLQYQTGKWQFGALARDITTTFNAWEINFTEDEKTVLLATGNELPDINSIEITNPRLILGVARTFDLNQNIALTPELNVDITTDGQRNTLISGDPFSLDPSLGVETTYKNLLAFRLGVNQFQRESDFDREDFLTLRPSLGIGLNIKALQIDYAFTDLGDSRNTFSHVISLLLELQPRD